ncbi:hypothetical protein [Shewanella aestuarii]|uniref:DNA gyrase subunit B n=1 Tax=Shewanella aestuarii TaxID=1028752 RepID=A0A6G9QGK8_9GAMM|nr:hypothetical protein [Shewanella aestuarii]QIR13303.1 hypothetical protein HBH39_01380 [Shewanella aestuarii]
MKAFVQVLSILAVMGYPIAVYFGLQYLPNGLIGLILCGLLIIRLSLNKNQLKPMLVPLVIGILLTGASFIAQRNDWLLYYPVVINLSMLALFGFSLIQGPSLIERLARLKEPDLPSQATPYLIKVTKIWCGLFVFNGLMALYTAMATDITIWTIYNGLIAYLLIGGLLGGEWIYRTFWLKQHG